MNTQERFESRVHLIPFTTCHIFESDDGNGYGRFSIGGRRDGAHRAAYRIYIGPISDGLFVLHSCDNKACVNPDHLRVGTQQDNMDDKVARSRTQDHRGSKHPLAKLTEADVLDIRANKDGLNQKELAAKYGLTPPTISLIFTRKSWIHI